MHFVGLDLSLTGSGIVVLDESGSVVATALDGWKLDRSASVREKIDRLVHIASTVMGVVHGAREGGVVVGIEGYAYNQRGATADLGELGGVVKTQLWLGFEVEPRIVAVSTARKLVFGNGKTKKDLVLPTLRDRGFVFEDHNVADAYVIAEAIRQQTVGGSDDKAVQGTGARRVGNRRRKRRG